MIIVSTNEIDVFFKIFFSPYIMLLHLVASS